MLFSFTNAYFPILAHSGTTTMVLLNDTNDIDNTYSLFPFATCVFFIFCIILSQTTTITEPASTTTSIYNRSSDNGCDCDKCGLIGIFIFNQFFSKYSSESDIASGPQLATIISDNTECPSPLGDSEIATEQDKYDKDECGLIAVFFLDEFLLNGTTSGDAAQKHDIVSATKRHTIRCNHSSGRHNNRKTC